MADNAVIGALRVVLGLDSASLEKGLKDASSSLASFGAGMAKAGAVAAAAFVAAGAGVAVAVHGIIDQADKLGKMSQKIGVPVEELSALKYAAELSDVSMDALGKSLGKLSKAMVEAAAKPTSDVANAFKALGVSATDSNGKLKSSSEMTADIAEKFAGLKDGAGKTAIAMALFGKSGAEMIPLLNGGKTSLHELTEEAKKFGIVLTKEMTDGAQEFNDNLKRLSKVKEGVIVQITAGMLPALKNLSASMVRVAGDSNLWKVAGEGIGEVMVSLFNGTERMSVAWARLGTEWKAFREFMQTDVFSGKVQENWKKFTDAGEETRRVLENLRITHEHAHLADAFGEIGKKAAAAAAPLKDVNYALLGGKNALVQFLDAQAKSLAAQQAELAATDMATGAKERHKIILQGLAVVKANDIKLTGDQRVGLTEAANAAELMALKIGNIRMVGESNPFAAIQAQLNATNLKLAEGGLKAEEYAVLSGQSAQLTQTMWSESAKSIVDSFGSIGSSMSAMSNNWARMAKAGQAIGAAVAFTNSYIAASNALATAIFPANIAIAAGVLAKGIAMVAAIKSAAIPHAAMGGAFRVPGGMGGGDRVFTPMMLEPGELVEVSSNRPGGYQASGRSGGGPAVNITIEGDNFSRSGIRKLISQINEAVGDGARLRIT